MSASPPTPPTAGSARSGGDAHSSRCADYIAAWRGAGVLVGLAAAVVGSAAGAVWYDVYATTPPCPPGWVQFLDWGPFMTWVCAGLVGVALLAAAIARRARGSRLVAVFACFLLAIASMAGAWALYSGYEQHGQTYAAGCLTFDRLISPTRRWPHGGSVPVGATIGRRPVPGTS
jgi:hypothetical protein